MHREPAHLAWGEDLRHHLTIPMALALLAACPDSEPEDTGPTPVELSEYAFTRATLTPDFEHANAVWAGTALLDYDNDGWLDIFLTNGRNLPDALYRNNHDGTFTDVAEEAGVDSVLENGAVTVGDIDNDGDTDIIVSGSCSTGTFKDNGGGLCDGHKLIHFNNGDGTFTPSEKLTTLFTGTSGELLRFGCCSVSIDLFDVDSDGDLDLMLSQGGDPDVETPWQFRKNRQEGVENFIVLNDGEGNFTEAIDMEYHDHKARISFVTASFDVDGDGYVDLLHGQAGFPVDIGHYDVEANNHLFDEDRWTTGDGLWMGLSVADFDRDADLDLYGTNQGWSPFMHGYDSVSRLQSELMEGEWINVNHSLLLNDGGLFTPADWPLSYDGLLAADLYEPLDGLDLDVEPVNLGRYGWGWGTVPIDVDADGWVDVAYTGNNCATPMDVVWTEEAGAGPGALLRNLEGQGFEDITWEAGIANVDDDGRYPDSRGLAVGDLNNDGYADLVYANRTYNPSLTDPLQQEVGVPRVWLAEPRDNNWLQVKATGTTSNRDGIGTEVLVDDGERQTRYIIGAGGGTSSTSERMLTIGLGQHESVDLTVTFQSGQVVEQTVTANQRIVIEEPR